MTTEPVSVPPQKVYVVDDDIVTRILLKEVLHAENLRVEAYSSAEDFLRACDTELRGCLVLDHSLPGMDGIELQKLLVERGNTAPVIFLTGAGDASIAARARSGGAVDFLEKPVEPVRMLSSVTRALALDRKNAQRRVGETPAQQ